LKPKKKERRNKRLRYYQLSKSQLEKKADELNIKFDKERLIKPKAIDVYDVVELIGCTPDWLYLSPDQSIFGLTSYNDGYYYAWEDVKSAKTLPPSDIICNGMYPHKILIKKNTIIIDRSINEGNNRGIENFSTIHECFHQLLHVKCFSYHSAKYQHFCKLKDFRSETGNRLNMTALEIIEYQANYCAAAFLMPQKSVTKIFLQQMELSSIPSIAFKRNYKIDEIINKMSKQFSVNYTPMKYRLQELHLISSEDSSVEEYLCC